MLVKAQPIQEGRVETVLEVAVSVRVFGLTWPTRRPRQR